MRSNPQVYGLLLVALCLLAVLVAGTVVYVIARWTRWFGQPSEVDERVDVEVMGPASPAVERLMRKVYDEPLYEVVVRPRNPLPYECGGPQ
jgi:hypothetical protein